MTDCACAMVAALAALAAAALAALAALAAAALAALASFLCLRSMSASIFFASFATLGDTIFT